MGGDQWVTDNQSADFAGAARPERAAVKVRRVRRVPHLNAGPAKHDGRRLLRTFVDRRGVPSLESFQCDTCESRGFVTFEIAGARKAQRRPCPACGRGDER
jgi:hypothetical protein